MRARSPRLGRALSLTAEGALGKAENDLGRRLVLGGFAGAACVRPPGDLAPKPEETVPWRFASPN